MNFKGSVLSTCAVAVLFFGAVFSQAASLYVPTEVDLPAPPQREFRGAWIATVGNIDWPSKPGLPVAQQKAELLAMLDRAVRLNLNAVILQVRPACDAIYESRIEPWSPYLTGAMGHPPAPFYDPLEFAVTEAHNRGLELHAWFNPYRAGVLDSKFAFSANHISRTHPKLVRKYGKYLWLDPGDKDSQSYSIRVVMDVVNRYDIDGVHFDDYFYPYKESDAKGREMDFPDEPTWRRYKSSGGRLSRDDWRRENINTFVHRLYTSIKAAKPWVKFGVAPFGIWQPGNPPQITGFNAYNTLYCDSRKWLINGWMDYCSPQLYWPINPPKQSFTALLKWWTEQNPRHRNLWPGIDTERVGVHRHRDTNDTPVLNADEFINQIKVTRELCDGGAGIIHWSIKCLMADQAGIATALLNGPYAQPALVPASPWLDYKFPSTPRIHVDAEGRVQWETAHLEKVASWVLQIKSAGHWRTLILPGDERSHALSDWPDAVCIREIDRCGVASGPAALVRHTEFVTPPAK